MVGNALNHAAQFFHGYSASCKPDAPVLVNSLICSPRFRAGLLQILLQNPSAPVLSQPAHQRQQNTAEGISQGNHKQTEKCMRIPHTGY